jgi:hypothetical protein
VILKNERIQHRLSFQVGNKLYGSSVSFYEKYEHELTEEQKELLNLTGNEAEDRGGAVVDDSGSNVDPTDEVRRIKLIAAISNLIRINLQIDTEK